MAKEWDVLVASANREHRRSFIRVLEELPLNVIPVSTEASDSPDPRELADAACLARSGIRSATDLELQIIRAAREERLREVPAAVPH